jgi:hypothetical protein
LISLRRLASFAGLIVFFSIGEFDGDGAFVEKFAAQAVVFFAALCDIYCGIGCLFYFCGVGGVALGAGGSRDGEEREEEREGVEAETHFG